MRKIINPFYLLAPLMVVFATSSSSYAQKQNPPNVTQQEVSEGDVVRVNTTLVTVPVSVMDRRGRFIPDLKQEQFHIYEDGVEQEIAYFKNAEKGFTVAILLDTSDSAKFRLKEIQDAAIAFVEQLRPEDHVIVVAFDRRVTVLTEATNDHSILEEAIRRAQTGRGTSLYNAVDLVISQRLKNLPGRKAIVLFTDGVDTASLKASYQSTLHNAEELDALVYTIQYNTYEDAAKALLRTPPQSQEVGGVLVTAKGEMLNVAYKRANLYLRLLADRTGGRFFYADTTDNLRKSFEQIAKELRQQYSIGYYPRKQMAEEGKRQIKVRVDVPDAVARARKSYIFKS